MSSTIETYREIFPHLRTGKLWLNHAAISPLNSRTKFAMEQYLTNRSEGSIDDFPHIVQSSIAAKEQLGLIINASHQRIGFVNNTSDGLNILANGIDWKSGDRILLNDSEFPTNVVPFLNLRRLGVEIDFVPTKNGDFSLDDIQRLITPKTRLLSISFVQFLSGVKTDLVRLGELCRNSGVLFCVDAIQGVGAVPIDVQASQIDFLSCGGHKWMLGMMGLGFIYLTEEMQSRLTQPYFGWTSNKNYFSNLFDYRLDPDDSARRYENGGQNNAGIVALGASAVLLNEVGIENIHQRLLMLTERIFHFADSNGIEIITPRESLKRAGIVTLKIPGAEKIFAALQEQKIIISLREGLLRISPHFYNTEDEMDTVCRHIHQLMS